VAPALGFQVKVTCALPALAATLLGMSGTLWLIPGLLDFSGAAPGIPAQPAR
jgi:hypothetical protein